MNIRHTVSQTKHRNSGYGLIEVLIAVGALSIVVLGVASFSGQMTKILGQTSSSAQFSIFRDNLITLIKNPASWARTVSINSSMLCLKEGTNCLTGAQPTADQLFALYDASASPNPYYDPTNPHNGVTALGQACVTYGQPNNTDCVYRYELKWTALCTPPNCTNPQVSVSAQLVYSGPGTSAFNPIKFSVPTIIRGAQ